MNSESEDAAASDEANRRGDCGPQGPERLRVWLQPAMCKPVWGHVRSRHIDQDVLRTLRVVAARNEYVGFQVQLDAKEDFVLSLSETNWLHALGNCPRARVRVDDEFGELTVEPSIVGFVEGDDGQDWGEYLDTSSRTQAIAYRTNAVYVRVFVPPDARPREHPLRVRVYTRARGFDEEVTAWEGRALVDVRPVTLPSPRQFSFHLDLWQHLTCLARHHGVALWSEEHFTVINRYFASLAALGQKALTVVASEVPWAGQQCFRDRKYPSYLFEHSVIRVYRHRLAPGHASVLAASTGVGAAATPTESAAATSSSVAAAQASVQNPLPGVSVAAVSRSSGGGMGSPLRLPSRKRSDASNSGSPDEEFGAPGAGPLPAPSYRPGAAPMATGSPAIPDPADESRRKMPRNGSSPWAGAAAEGAGVPVDAGSPAGGVTGDQPSRLEFDFTALDKLIALASTHGMDREIEVFGLLSVWEDSEFGFGSVLVDGPDTFVRVPCTNVETGCVGFLRTMEELRAYVTALYEHFASLGVLERVRICADEPANLAAFRERLRFLREAAPGFRYKVAINHFEFMEHAPPEVIDCVPYLPLACRDPGLTMKLHQRVRSKGGRMLWYVCCVPDFPNSFLSSPLVEAQLHGWLTYFLKLDGFLRWNFCLWPDDPWRKVSWRAPLWKAGDMYFVLPGSDGGPVLTLRYEGMRRAVQDYELLRLAQRVLPPAAATEVMNEVYAQVFHTSHMKNFQFVGSAGVRAQDLYTHNPFDFEAARSILMNAIAQHAPSLGSAASSAVATSVAVVGVAGPVTAASHSQTNQGVVSLPPLASAASAASSAGTVGAAAYGLGGHGVNDGMDVTGGPDAQQ